MCYADEFYFFSWSVNMNQRKYIGDFTLQRIVSKLDGHSTRDAPNGFGIIKSVVGRLWERFNKQKQEQVLGGIDLVNQTKLKQMKIFICR